MYGYFFQLDPMKIENLVHEIILLDSAGFKHVTYESQGQHAIHDPAKKHSTGIPRFKLLMWGQINKLRKAKIA